MIGVDDNQREIIRVDRHAPNDAIEIVPDEQLARKGDRIYYKQAIKLQTDEIYVSPLTLDRRGETIIMPPAPTLRVATPIFTSGGKLFGIFVIDVDMRPAFDRVRSSARSGENVYLIEQSGDYLVHPDRSREFGSMLGKPTNWRSDFPSIAVSLDTTQGVSQILADQNGRPGGIALVPAMLAGNQPVAVIKTAPNEVIMATAATIQNTSVLGGLVAVLGAAILAVLMARSLTRPIVQLTAAVERTGRNGRTAIPVEASGETGVLARAFARVMGEANAKTIELEDEVREHRRTGAARDRLVERERLFSAAVESSHDAIITESLDGKITGWNRAAERLFGFTAAEAVGQDIDLIVPPERRSEMRHILSKIGRGGAGRGSRNRAIAPRWKSGPGFDQHFSNQGAVGRDHRRVQDRPRHHRSQENTGGAQPGNRGTAAHLRDLPGPDPGHRQPGRSGSGQPQFASYTGIRA